MRYHSSHANDGTLTDNEWCIGSALLYTCASANVGMITNMDIAIAMNRWGERNIIPNYAIMPDIAIEVAVKEFSNTAITSNCSEVTENRAFANLILHHILVRLSQHVQRFYP